MLPAVHAVGNAGERERRLAVREAHRRQHLGVCEVQLKVQRRKLRHAQLARHVQHDLPRRGGQAAEQIRKPRRAVFKPAELRIDIPLHGLVREGKERLVGNALEAAAAHGFARHLLENRVDERADLGRCKGLLPPGLGLESVFEEERIGAGGIPLRARGGKPRLLPKERLRALRRERGAQQRSPPAKLRELLRRSLGVPRIGRQRALVLRAAHCARRELQRRGGRAHFAPERLGLLRREREKLLCPRHEKRLAQRLPLRAHHGAHHRETLVRQGEGAGRERIFAPEILLAPAADVHVVREQLLPLLDGEHTRRLPRAGNAVVRAAKENEVLHAAAAHAVQLARRHAVERDRDRAHVVFREHQEKQPRKALRVHLRLAENRGKLLERADEDLPDLLVFCGKRLAPVRSQLL